MEHVDNCGIDTCGDGLYCDCPCHDERLASYTLKPETNNLNCYDADSIYGENEKEFDNLYDN